MSKKILVADDSVVIQKSIGITFAQEDFDITFVGNGEEAFQRAKELKPDLILADTSMPKLSGGDLCKKFRQDPQFRTTPIILLASSTEKFTAAQLQSFGANDFVQKPFESTALLEKIRPLISGAGAATSAAAAAPARAPIPAPSFEKIPMDDKPSIPISQGLSVEEEETLGVLDSQNIFPGEAPSAEFDNEFIPTASSVPAPGPETVANLDVLSLDMEGDDDSDEIVDFEKEEPPVPSTKVLPKAQARAPMPPPPRAPAPTPMAAPSASSAPLQLSEQQIEQIVSKVFQSVIERIAWEVVPELAERIIKEELAKITDDQ